MHNFHLKFNHFSISPPSNPLIVLDLCHTMHMRDLESTLVAGIQQVYEPNGEALVEPGTGASDSSIHQVK